MSTVSRVLPWRRSSAPASVELAPLLATHAPYAQDLSNTLAPPSAQNWFGYDPQGCDYYTNVIYGARASILVGVLATFGVLVLGSFLGLLAGYVGGLVDTLISRLGDIFFAIPLLLSGIIFLSSLRDTEEIWGIPIQGYFGVVIQVVLVFVLFGWPSLMRLMRSSVIQVKPNDYVQAARALGAISCIARSHSSLTATGLRCRGRGRANSRNSVTRVASRRISSLTTSVASTISAVTAPFCMARRRNDTWSWAPLSGLRISWATPATTRPRPARRCSGSSRRARATAIASVASASDSSRTPARAGGESASAGPRPGGGSASRAVQRLPIAGPERVKRSVGVLDIAPLCLERGDRQPRGPERRVEFGRHRLAHRHAPADQHPRAAAASPRSLSAPRPRPAGARR